MWVYTTHLVFEVCTRATEPFYWYCHNCIVCRHGHNTEKKHHQHHHDGPETDEQQSDRAASKNDEDDDEDVYKARAWDDWKDGKQSC